MSKANKPSAAASSAASALARARWAKVPRKERVRQMTAIGKLGGRPSEKRRCFCGKATWRRALSRNFDCCRAAGVLSANADQSG